MGATLRLIAVAHPHDVPLRWEAGHRWIDTYKDQLVAHPEWATESAPWYDDVVYGGFELDPDDLATNLHDSLDLVRSAVTGGFAFHLDGWDIHVWGGETHGDPPSPLFEAAEYVCSLPSLLEIVGLTQLEEE